MSGRYIVVFKDHVPQSEIDKYANEVNANGGEVAQRYDNVLKGFSATIPEAYLQRLQSFQDSIIDYIGMLRPLALGVPPLSPSIAQNRPQSVSPGEYDPRRYRLMEGTHWHKDLRGPGPVEFRGAVGCCAAMLPRRISER
ncbi:hypothetical protein BN946_scf184941.g35 [Trametes cinnabarina]|uniref:Inhibitor I9 domain-containing protein n=1 Tax=Pycnoporus cinnabarinus TaxID=5643 RepID=A0A060SMC7_PYCCI|nr:hypothetical protein BN946_scf184941.g35 [Trametes cinnabarina]